jgi:hypothetical protein
MYILEQGRTRVENGSNVPNSVKINIRTGTYSATELVTELQFALNTVPLFDDITFDVFSSQFNASGDYSIMFNAPTPNSYNSLLKEYQTGLTRSDIVARYFQVVQTAGNVAFNVEQCKVAYYYPAIKEMIIAQPDPVPFDVRGISIPTGFDSWYSYLVFGFTGLDDPSVQAILNMPGNIAIFENYRAQHTFNQFLVNKYTCKYDTTRGRLTIAAPSLCDSLTTDINAFYNTALSGLVASNGFTNLATFYQSYSNALNSNASLAEYYDFIQLQFSKYFGVSLAQYSALFYANTCNEINIYNTCNQYGWKLSFSADVFATQLNEFPPPTQQPILWSNILNYFAFDTNEFVSTLSVSSFGMNEMLEFPGSGPDTFGYTDTIFPVWPGRYNRVLFTTKCRQNISLMTIPRYENNRGAGTDMSFPYLLQPTDTNPVPDKLKFLYEPYFSFPPGYSTFYIKTDISGKLKTDISENDLINALHPTSAVCGMPLEAARNFILENEKYNRKYYAGFLGEYKMQEQTNLFVNLRCCEIESQNTILYVGCGITKDSQADKEFLETENKALTIWDILVKSKK